MPPNWQEFSQENLRHCNQERETSMRLRGVIGQTLSQTSQDMREQADRCEEALSRRVSETEEATRGLEDQLKQVCVSDEKIPTHEYCDGHLYIQPLLIIYVEYLNFKICYIRV